MASFRKAYLLKRRIARRLLKRKGIHGVGVGLHDPNRPKKGAAIIVYAEALSSTAHKKRKVKKRPTAVPQQLKSASGVPFRIVRCRRFCKHGKLGARSKRAFTGRIRPVIAGYSVGTPDASGTAGLIVSDRSGGRRILSNNHVLVNNNTSRFSATLQPGGADRGRRPQDRIGNMDRFVKLRKKSANYLDAATSKPLRRGLLKPAYAVFGAVPGHVVTYKVGDRFKKVGRTTGVVTGTVESIHTDIQVDYGDYGNLGTITFKDQSVIRGKGPVSLAGDSGSVWLTARGNQAAAVNFAGSENGRLSISYPVQWFMQVFRARVARPGKSALLRAQRGRKLNYRYVRPLTSKVLGRISLMKGRARSTRK
ncbi:hypothetical protein [Paenibacillus sp. TH7-28]